MKFPFPLLSIVIVVLPTAAYAVSDQGIIGWDGDKNAGLAMSDGTIGIRGRPELNLPGPDLRWGIRGVGHAITKDLPASTSSRRTTATPGSRWTARCSMSASSATTIPSAMTSSRRPSTYF